MFGGKQGMSLLLWKSLSVVALFVMGTVAVSYWLPPYDSKGHPFCCEAVKNPPNQVSAFLPKSESTPETASTKEIFNLSTKMLDRYEGTITGLMNANVALYVVIIGWALASTEARQTLGTLPSLCRVSMVVLTVVMAMYGGAIHHWLWRWTCIKKNMDELNFVDRAYYPGYELPWESWLSYFLPVGVLYLFVMFFLLAIVHGEYFDPSTGRARRSSQGPELQELTRFSDQI